MDIEQNKKSMGHTMSAENQIKLELWNRKYECFQTREVMALATHSHWPNIRCGMRKMANLNKVVKL